MIKHKSSMREVVLHIFARTKLYTPLGVLTVFFDLDSIKEEL